MERDPLEQFVLQHRKAFDTAAPPTYLWRGVETRLRPEVRPRFKLSYLVKVAAAAVLLLGIGGVTGSYLTMQSQQGDPMAAASAEMKEAATYYGRQIDAKLQVLASYPADPTVTADMQQLDEVMQELQDELAKAPRSSEQQIIENMIQNYQAKLAILERVIERMQNATQNSGNDEIDI